MHPEYRLAALTVDGADGTVESLSRIDLRLLLRHALSGTDSTLTINEHVAHSWPLSREHSRATVIGAGSCGTVYALRGGDEVHKLATPGGCDSQLLGEYLQHTTIVECYEKFTRECANGFTGIHVQIPQPLCYVNKNNTDWWSGNMRKFPRNISISQDVLITQRIKPLHHVVHRALVRLYSAEVDQEEVSTDPKSDDCLIRISLVRQRQTEKQSKLNSPFCLHIDQMEEMEVDSTRYAVAMGQALAIMHLDARCDARGIRLVLGGTYTTATTTVIPRVRLTRKQLDAMSKSQGDKLDTEQATRSDLAVQPHAVRLWIIGFDQVRDMTLDDAGVALAVEAFFLNDSCYPRPLFERKTDQELWRVFLDAYLSTADEVRKDHRDGPDDLCGFAGKFVENVLLEQRIRMEKEAALHGRKSGDRSVSV